MIISCLHNTYATWRLRFGEWIRPQICCNFETKDDTIENSDGNAKTGVADSEGGNRNKNDFDDRKTGMGSRNRGGNADPRNNGSIGAGSGNLTGGGDNCPSASWGWIFAMGRSRRRVSFSCDWGSDWSEMVPRVGWGGRNAPFHCRFWLSGVGPSLWSGAELESCPHDRLLGRVDIALRLLLGKE